jgi:hypothetical protein
MSTRRIAFFGAFVLAAVLPAAASSHQDLSVASIDLARSQVTLKAPTGQVSGYQGNDAALLRRLRVGQPLGGRVEGPGGGEAPFPGSLDFAALRSQRPRSFSGAAGGARTAGDR